MEKSLQKYNTETSELSERIATIDDEYGRKLREKDLEKEQLVGLQRTIIYRNTILGVAHLRTRRKSHLSRPRSKHENSTMQGSPRGPREAPC